MRRAASVARSLVPGFTMSEEWNTRRTVCSALLATAMVLALAVPVVAYQEEGGYENCGDYIGYTHAYFSIDGLLFGPGASVGVYYDYSSGWHSAEENGDYSGDWFARGYPSLDFPNTYAGCRPYG